MGAGSRASASREVAHHYLALGAVSPINEQNRSLLAALRTALAARDLDLPLYWGNRNAPPYLAGTLRELGDAGHAHVLALTTSAYSSYSSCRQYREDLAAALEAAGLASRMRIEKVRAYFDHPGFVGPFADAVVAALAELDAAKVPREQARLIFTTHSIPKAMADTSGPPDRRGEPEGGGAYVAQHLAVAREVLRRIAATLRGPLPPWRLAYQSRSGDGRVPWLEPDIGDVLRDVAGEGAAAVIVVPIGFISDHVEVSWDLNHEAAETAAGLGLRMIRVATPGTDEAFVRGLVDLVEERVRGTPPLAATPLGPWPGTCAVCCCPNPRRGLPAVAGVDAPF